MTLIWKSLLHASNIRRKYIMRLRHIKGAEEEIAESPYVVQDPQSLKGRWHEFFGNDNPIRIEVGMGKGKFIMELAQMNPDIN